MNSPSHFVAAFFYLINSKVLLKFKKNITVLLLALCYHKLFFAKTFGIADNAIKYALLTVIQYLCLLQNNKNTKQIKLKKCSTI